MKSFNNFFGEARTKAGLEAEKKGLVHTGKGYYADKAGKIVAKAEGGTRLVPLSKKEQDNLNAGAPLKGPQSAADAQSLAKMASDLQSVKDTVAPEQPPEEEPKADEKSGEEESLLPRNEGGGEVVIVDDVLATGGTLKATNELAEKAGYKVVGNLVLVDLKYVPRVEDFDLNVRSVITYE